MDGDIRGAINILVRGIDGVSDFYLSVETMKSVRALVNRLAGSCRDDEDRERLIKSIIAGIYDAGPDYVLLAKNSLDVVWNKMMVEKL